MSYEPRGKVKNVLEAMRAEPERIWTSVDVAKVLEVNSASVSAHLDTSIRHGLIYRQIVAGRVQYNTRPFAPAYVPPQMTAPREGSDVRMPSRAPASTLDFGKRSTSAATASGHELPDDTAAASAAASLSVANGGDARVASAGCADHSEEQAQDEPEEAVEPDAYVSCRTGEIVLVGLDPDEEGRVTIPADLVMAIRRLTAWAPPA